jgi:hypothetical protein
MGKTAGDFADNILIRVDLASEPLINIRVRGTVRP